MLPLTADELAALPKNARIFPTETDDGTIEVVIRRAAILDIERFGVSVDKATTMDARRAAVEDLVHDCLLRPKGRTDEARALLLDLPGLAQAISEDLVRMARGEKAERAKKASP